MWHGRLTLIGRSEAGTSCEGGLQGRAEAAVLRLLLACPSSIARIPSLSTKHIHHVF